MAEKVTIGNCELWHGDCREVLPLLPPVDLVLTDPPYGIDYAPTFKKWNGDKSEWSKIHGDTEKFCPGFLLSQGRSVIIWGSNYFSDLLPVGGWMTWDKRCSDRLDAMIGNPCEFAWNSFGVQAVARILHGGVVNADSTNGNNDPRFHPTQKPVKLMEWCIQHAPNPATVCDPFMGSGTTGVACARMGLQFVGIERERKYFDIACRRIEQAYAQPRLFEDAKVGAGDTAIQEDWTK